MSDVAVRAVARADRSLLAGLLAALVVGAALVAGARIGAIALLAVVAAVQAVLAFAWVLGIGLPGRWGGLLLAAGAAAAADVTVSVWPHGRLGVLIGVLGLAIPAMFVHQLTRGAARVHLVASMSGIAVLLFGEIALAALSQLQHEFAAADPAGRVAAAAALIVAVALVTGYLLDLVVPVPRIDPQVARGLPALLVSIGAGTLAGYFMLRAVDGFGAGRSALVGLVVGAAAALVAVAAAFVVADAPAPRSAGGRRLRPVAAAVFPFAVLAPVAFLICLAVRS